MARSFHSFPATSWVVGSVLLAACGGAGASGGASPSPSGVSTQGRKTTPSPAGSFVRTCESSVYGDLGKDWRDHSLVVGSIAFVGLPGAGARPRAEFAPDKEGFKSWKSLAVVERGTEVTVAVPIVQRRHVALLYDPEAFNSHQMTDGDTEVTFRACGAESAFQGPTQFNGAFIVDGPQCATLEVTAGKGRVKRVQISFGRGMCARPA
jgi:hypothetical protein